MKPVRISAKALIIENGKLLCIKHSDPEGFFYGLPGGGQEHSETLTDALIRECREELGSEVVPGRLLYVREYIGRNYGNDHHQVELMFECQLGDHAGLGCGHIPDSAQVGVEWLPLENLNKYRLYPMALIPVLMSDNWDSHVVYMGGVD